MNRAQVRLRGRYRAISMLGLALLVSPWVARAESPQEEASATAQRFDISASPLADALTAFGVQSGLQVSFARETVAGLRSPGLQGDATPAEALEALLRGNQLEYSFLNGSTVVIRQAQPPSATVTTATGTLTGRVTQAGEPVAGATVTATSEALEESRVVTTDDEGNYELTDLPPGKYSLRFELEGLVPVTKEAEVSPDESTTLNIQMSLPEVREEMIVTGSRIRRAEVEGPSPVIFITREDLDRSGRTTVAEALAQLPQNLANPVDNSAIFALPGTVNLRGLGADQTLVLVNGRRPAYSAASHGQNTVGGYRVDLNSIPLAAVERIEVLTDGGSAVYGTDATAGVVNIILKEDFRGTDVSVRYGGAFEGGAGEPQVTFTTGGAKGGWRGVLSGEYMNRQRLDSTDRSFSESSNQSARGGRDFRSSGVARPGNVSSLDGQNLPGLDAPVAGIPGGQDGRNLTPADFIATAGQRNLLDSAVFNPLIFPSERYGLTGRVDRELGSRLALFAEVGGSRTTFEGSFSPVSLTAVVPASNPFNPFGEDVQVEWLSTEPIGQQTTDNTTDNLRTLVGLKGRLGRSWAWETAVGYSRDEADLFQPIPSSISSDIVTTLLSRSDSETALNLFGDGASGNSPVILAELGFWIPRQIIESRGEALTWDGKLDGVVTKWAGRELRAATGIEFREESFDFVQELFRLDPQSPPELPRSGGGQGNDRELAASFVEFSLPLFGPEHQVRGVRALELQLAGRFESYSDFGGIANPKFAVRWQPIRSLALRGSWGTGFRAPSLSETSPTSQVLAPSFPVFDPRRNESVLVDLRFGSNPDLEPEESESWNLGVLWDVPAVRGLSLTADVYDLQLDDGIGALGFDQVQELETFFPDRVSRAEPTPEDIAAGLPGRLVAVDFSSLNLSRFEIRGVDLGLNYFKDTAIGRFDLRLNGAYIDSLKQQFTPGAPLEQLAGTTATNANGSGSPSRFRSNLSLFWSRGAWELGVTERYTGRVRELSAASPTFGQFIDDHLETDLQINYHWPGSGGPLAGTQLSFGVENLFNQKPPFRDVSSGYFSRLHSPRQAFPHLTITKSFGGTSR